MCDILSCLSAFVYEHEDCSCRRMPWRILQSCIWMVFLRCGSEYVPEVAKVVKMTFHNVDTDRIDCAFGRASKMLALTHKLYHKLGNVSLFCLVNFDVFVDVWRDLNLRMRRMKKCKSDESSLLIGDFFYCSRINKEFLLTCRIFLPTFWTNVIIHRTFFAACRRRRVSYNRRYVIVILMNISRRLNFIIQTAFVTPQRFMATAAAATITRQTFHRFEISMMMKIVTIELMEFIFALCWWLFERSLLLPIKDFMWIAEQTFSWIIVRWDGWTGELGGWLPIIFPLFLCWLIAAIHMILIHILRLVDIVFDCIDVRRAELASN